MSQQYFDLDHYDKWRDEKYEYYSEQGQYYRAKDGSIVTPEMEREQEARRRRLREAEAKRRERFNASVTKECAECFREKPHDPDDYRCIVCRDGHNALPKKTYPQVA